MNRRSFLQNILAAAVTAVTWPIIAQANKGIKDRAVVYEIWEKPSREFPKGQHFFQTLHGQKFRVTELAERVSETDLQQTCEERFKVTELKSQQEHYEHSICFHRNGGNWC